MSRGPRTAAPNGRAEQHGSGEGTGDGDGGRSAGGPRGAHGSRDGARVVVAAALVLVLCVVVGGASAARDAESRGDVAFDATAAAGLAASLSYLFLVGFLALGVRLLVQLLRRGHGDDAPDEEEQQSALEVTTPVWLQRLIVLGIVAALLLAAWLTWTVIHTFLSMPPPPADQGATGTPPLDAAPDAPAGGAGVPDLAVLLLVLVGVALAAVFVVWLVRRAAAGAAVDAVVPMEETAPLLTPLDDPFAVDLGALGALEPRAAVVASFDAAQRMVSATGARAGWDETAAEHVRRVGPSLPGAAPPALDHLLGLYHEARFSEHPITPAHRRDAISALGQLRDALGAVMRADALVAAGRGAGPVAGEPS